MHSKHILRGFGEGILLISLLIGMVTIGEARAMEQQACHAAYKQAVKFDIPETLTHDHSEAKSLIHHHWEATEYWGIKERAEVISKADQPHSLRVFYPKGSLNPSHPSAERGGAGFYLTKDIPAQLTRACLRYQVYFPEDFIFGRGGKLPGLFGGEPPSGCEEGSELKGFSTRYMWREKGEGTLYAYIPHKKKQCGQLMGRGSWSFPKGKWIDIQQEIILNDPDSENGAIRIWVNGKKVLERHQQTIRMQEDIVIEGIMFSTFFGGKDPSWASPQDQHADFRSFVVYY